MLVELSVVEQRCDAVPGVVRDGIPHYRFRRKRRMLAYVAAPTVRESTRPINRPWSPSGSDHPQKVS